MAIKPISPGHDYKVFVTIRIDNGFRDRDDAISPFPRLNFKCNVGVKYVPDTTDASIPAYITKHDSWSFFHLPLDLLTCDDNFSSYQPRTFITNMLRLMKIPFKLDRLYLKKSSDQDKESVPLGNSDDVVTLIFNAACAMADAVRFPEKSKESYLLHVGIEKRVTLPHGEYVGILKTKQEDLLCKVRDQVVRMLQLEEEGQKLPESEWKNMVDIVVKSGFGQAMQNYLTSLMKQSSRECTEQELAEPKSAFGVAAPSVQRPRAQCGCQSCAPPSTVPKTLD